MSTLFWRPSVKGGFACAHTCLVVLRRTLADISRRASPALKPIWSTGGGAGNFPGGQHHDRSEHTGDSDEFMLGVVLLLRQQQQILEQPTHI